MALRTDGRAVAAVESNDGGWSTEVFVWGGLYALLALGLTLLGVLGAVYVATTLFSGPVAIALAIVGPIGALAVGPALARLAVRASYARVDARLTERAARLAAEAAEIDPVAVEETAVARR